ncbi:uncharacterized protein LOC131145683 [Malania oleifera]|uniref:uncharacterized protein LOC131145683 n=1 Tax=Malania oleifera TaxID=397392 RepID=UPI0025AE600C|nr:uncharacterized protein LOC131145683 [Malania oleifera]
MTSPVSSSEIDPSNPYFMHHGESLGSLLVSQQLTGPDDYPSWRRAIILAISAKNKSCFINGTIAKPKDEDPLFAAWSKCNTMILSWLLNVVSRDIASSVLYHEFAKYFWDDIAVRFQQSNGPRLYQLKKDISDLMQENLTVTAYFTRLKGLWDELSNYIATKKCVCGQGCACVKSSHEDYVLQFLMGLNDTYSQIRIQILLSDPLPSINKVYALIVQEERQRAVTGHVPSIESAAMMSKNYSSSNAHPQRHYKYNKQKGPCIIVVMRITQ